MKPVDVLNNHIRVGDTVLRAVIRGKSPMLDMCVVTDVVDGRVYLDNSKQAIVFTDRLVVVQQ